MVAREGLGSSFALSNFFLSGSAVRVWAHTSGRRLQTLLGHSGRVTSVAFDDQYILSGCSGGQARLWSMDDGRCLRGLKGHTAPVTSCLMGAAGMPITGAEDGTVRIWDAAQGHTVVSLLAGEPVQSLAISHELGRLVVGAWGLSLWDLSTGQQIAALPVDSLADGGGYFGCVSTEGPLVAAACKGLVVLHDTRTCSPVSHLVVR